MKIDLAIIGGTGIGSRLMALPGRSIAVSNAGGLLHGRVVEFAGSRVLAIQRHSAGHATPPHRVAYAAVALGLKALGIRFCLATAAVGSLRADWPVGTLVVCTDFIDASARNLTLFDDRVIHTPMNSPFGDESILVQAMSRLGLPSVSGGAVYLQAKGPRYETDAEIRAYSRLGADLVGMTAASEATLLREAGLRYECLAVVTNLAAGLGPEIDHGAVGDVMSDRSEAIFEVLGKTVELIHERGDIHE